MEFTTTDRQCARRITSRLWLVHYRRNTEAAYLFWNNRFVACWTVVIVLPAVWSSSCKSALQPRQYGALWACNTARTPMGTS